VRLLLDTHTFLWFIGGDAALSSYARQLVEDRTNATAMTLGGNGSINGYAGLIYAPAAPVHLAGTGTLALTSLIAGSASLEGTAVATVG
jgi:hypothetical protein